MTDQRRESAAPGEADVAAAKEVVRDWQFPKWRESTLTDQERAMLLLHTEPQHVQLVAAALATARRDAGAAMREACARIAQPKWECGSGVHCAHAAAIRALPAPEERGDER